MLCFAVYSLERRITRIYRELLEPFGLSYTQFLVLTLLHASDEPVSVSGFGTALDLDSGTLSPLLRRLEARGLVTRTRDAVGDERVVRIALTAEGGALRDDLGEVGRCLAERIPLDGDEAASLMASLRLANARLSAA